MRRLLHAIAVVAATLFWVCLGALLLLIAGLTGLLARAAWRVSDWLGRLSDAARDAAFWCSMRIEGP